MDSQQLALRRPDQDANIVLFIQAVQFPTVNFQLVKVCDSLLNMKNLYLYNDRLGQVVRPGFCYLFTRIKQTGANYLRVSNEPVYELRPGAVVNIQIFAGAQLQQLLGYTAELKQAIMQQYMLFENIERFPVRYKIVSGQDKAVRLLDLRNKSTLEMPLKFFTHKIQLYSQQLVGCYVVLKNNANAIQDDVKVYSIIAPSFVQFFA